MDSNITYSNYQGKAIIKISPKPKFTFVLGIVLFFVLPSLTFLIIIYNAFSDRKVDLESIFMLSLAIFFLIATVKYLKRAFLKEVIEINKNYLILSKHFIIKYGMKKYLLNDIHNVRYLGKDNFTEHPLAVKDFDYLGIGTGEKEIQFLIEKGRLGFNYNDKQIRFGRNIYKEDGYNILSNIIGFLNEKD